MDVERIYKIISRFTTIAAFVSIIGAVVIYLTSANVGPNVLAVFIIAFVVFVAFSVWIYTHPAATAKISYPLNMSEIEWDLTINGMSQNVSNNQRLWIVLFIPLVQRYYPQQGPVAINETGNWEAHAFVGQPAQAGLKVDILVIIAHAKTSEKINETFERWVRKNDFKGCGQLPKGVTIADRISVIRK